MKSLILAAMLLLSASANATTYYFINNKPADRADAMMASLKTPEIKIKRVKVDFVYVNKKTGRFKKAGDATFSQIPNRK